MRSIQNSVMKRTILSLGAIFSLVLSPVFAVHSAEPPKDDGPNPELVELVGAISKKLRSTSIDERTPENFAEELAAFDTLLKKQKGNDNTVAEIPYMKAKLYMDVFRDEAAALEVYKQVREDYPDTRFGRAAGEMVKVLGEKAEMLKIQEQLKVGSKFPDFNVKDLEGKPLSLERFSGKVVLLDFWATWCGPCIAELPHVLETYEKYHSKGFEVIGISLDREREELETFIKKRKMPWPQYMDGEGEEFELAEKYGVNAIPATFLIDGKGTILAKDLRGEALGKAVAEALEN